MDKSTLMDQWAAAYAAFKEIEAKLDKALFAAFGAPSGEDPPFWLKDWYYDGYDSSVEVKEIPEEFQLSEEGKQILRDAGICRVFRMGRPGMEALFVERARKK